MFDPTIMPPKVRIKQLVVDVTMVVNGPYSLTQFKFDSEEVE
jgi:hypothetical protein